jgi:conjugative relaxase-like TrwC/TraI family protein
MLSIGKVGLARNQQLYYEQQVAQGREDYYAGRGEAAGRWAGSGARLLGLEGELDADQLTALMDGNDPATGVQLARRTGRCSTAALDLTFSAPKSVSVLFAVGDRRLARQLVEAHEEAVDAALGYLERDACRVRRGHNGTWEEREAGDPRGWERARSEAAAGFVAAAYRHRMSRAQDPQLHTHVVCANMAQGRDGRWTALDGRAIYEHAKAADCVYQAHLRHAVKQRLPWASWGMVRDGMAELDQVPAGVREEFSQRRRRIVEHERELETAGIAVGREGRERIAFATREPKREIADADWRAEVRARAAEHGLGHDTVDQLDKRPAAFRAEVVSETALGRRLFSPNGSEHVCHARRGDRCGRGAPGWRAGNGRACAGWTVSRPGRGHADQLGS